MIDSGSRTALALSTLSKNSSWKRIHTNSRRWWQRPLPLPAKSPSAPPPKIRRSVQLLGNAHTLPIDDRQRTPSVLARAILSNNDCHYKYFQYEHANTNPRAKATNVRGKPCCSVVADPFAGKSLAHRKSEIRKEPAALTQNAARWFLFGSYVPTASTLDHEEKLQIRIPQLGWGAHHPRLEFFVHNVQKAQRERAKRAFMKAWRLVRVVSPCLP